MAISQKKKKTTKSQPFQPFLSDRDSQHDLRSGLTACITTSQEFDRSQARNLLAASMTIRSSKKRKVSTAGEDVVDLCSPEKGVCREQQQQAEPVCAIPENACFLNELVKFADKLKPSADSNLGPQERLRGLKGLLLSISGQVPHLLVRIAPDVREWVRWCLSPGRTSAESRLLDIALVIGSLDAFFAACVDCQLSETQSKGPRRSSGVKQTIIKDVMSALKLTREQFKDLSMLPFSSALGLDDTFAQPESQAPLDPKLLAAAKVGALRVQLASFAHDESDATNPLSKTSALAKAAADSDAAVRAAAAVLAPCFACCSSKHRMVLQACVAMLLRLAEDPDPRVQVAVACGLRDVIVLQALREQKMTAVRWACAKAAEYGDFVIKSPWHQQSGNAFREEQLKAASPELTAEELAGFAEKLLLRVNAEDEVQAWMLSAALLWFSRADGKDAAAAKETLRACVRCCGSPSLVVRRLLLEAADVLTQPHLVWSCFGGGAAPPAAAESAAYAAAECTLLREIEEQLKQTASDTVMQTLLYTLTAVGERLQSSVAELHTLLYLLTRVDDPVPVIAATAREMLEGGIAELIDMEEHSVALKILPSALAKLACSEDQHTLNDLAEKVSMDLKTLMRNYGHHTIAKHLYEGYEGFDKLMAFIEKVTGEEFLVFLQSVMQNVIIEIIGQAGASSKWAADCSVPDSVFERAQSMLRGLGKIQGQSEDAADFLAESDQVTRILKSYGDALERATAGLAAGKQSKADAAAQLRILRCVVLLLRLTGAFSLRYVPQMMVLLNSSLRHGSSEAVKMQSLEGWHVLVATLAVHGTSVLASVMNQVVAALLEPLQEGGAVMTAAVRVLETLIITHGDVLQDHIKALPPLPQSLPALARVNEVIAQQRGRLMYNEQIQLLLPALGHHSQSVRAMALQELRDHLNSHRQRLWGLLAGSARSSRESQAQQTALLSSLVSALLKCRDSEAQSKIGVKAQLLCAECLGLLGAIDPARLALEPPAPDSLHTDTTDLLVELISSHLVRLLRVAPSLQVLDATTFAIQELMKPYGRPGAGQDKKRNQLFALLSSDVQALVQPYLDSHYTVVGSGTTNTHIIFTTSGIPFWRWLCTWLRQLVDNFAKGELLVVFRACSLVMRRDVQTCLYLMPYVIHNVLQCGSDGGQRQVEREIVAVLRGGHANKEGELCVQAVFTLLDMLKKWAADHLEQAMREESVRTSSRAGSYSTSSPKEAEQQTRHITDLLEGIPQDLLAQAAFRCGAHARALQYYESFVREKERGALNPAAHWSSSYTDDEVSFLQEVYGKLEEPDGLSGLMCLRRSGLKLQDQIVAAEKAGCWTDALALHEHVLQFEDHHPAHGGERKRLSVAQRGRLQCLLHLGHLKGMLAEVEGWSKTAHGLELRQLAAIGTAGAWRFGQWELLKSYLTTASDDLEGLGQDDIWELRIGKLLSTISSRERVQTKLALEDARRSIMAPLSAASMESYTRAYPFLVKLHMLQELSDAAVLLQEGSVASLSERQRRLRWEERLNVMQASLAVQEPVLALRRQLAGLSGAEKEASQCSLQLAKICRATGHLQAALIASLQAVEHEVPGAQIEHSRLLWDVDHSDDAIKTLQQDLKAADDLSSHQMTQLSPDKKTEMNHSKTEILLQLAQWKAVKGQGDQNEITGLFNRAIGLETSEMCFFHFAKYLDQLMQGAKQRQEGKTYPVKGMDRIGGKSRIQLGKDQPFVAYVAQVIKNYGKAVGCGNRHIYQSLPRLLTVWFEFGTYTLGLTSKTQTPQDREAQKAVPSEMRSLFKNLPMYVWLVALPQLTSRICHAHRLTEDMTKHILTRITNAFPQQALWALAMVSKSKVQVRRKAANDILESAKRNTDSPDPDKLLEDRQLYTLFPDFCDQLLSLCVLEPSSKHSKTLSAKKEVSVLTRMMPLQILVPTSATLSLALPESGHTERDHQPFSTAITIHDIKDRIELMASLQRPKKIVFIGSDGVEYPFLLKNEDDLRKDSRMMETAGLLNSLFAKEPLSRRRNLYIRRFAVTPFSEKCGLIEWVNNTNGIRNLVLKVYKTTGHFDGQTNKAVKDMYDAHERKGTSSRKDLMEKVLERFPPMFHKHFLSSFPEPASWLNARITFTRTSAVWCMVGHMLGLGDRHGENILMDTKTGEVVQIDFACLFDKGVTLLKPEMVPFRLTQNVIDAFGVSGYEGAFRKVSEITLRVLREHRDALYSVLETFVHDPLVDWTMGSHGSGSESDSGGENPQAKDAFATIQGRLTGTLLGVRSIPSLPQSVEAQVKYLISEAVDKENLGQMYIWWQAWL